MSGQARMQGQSECVQNVTVPIGTGNVKQCTKCGESKPATLDYFHAYKRSLDGVRSVCKMCRSNISRMNRKNNPYETHEKERIRREANRERIRAASRKWSAANIERERERARRRRVFDAEQLRINRQRWKEKNVEKERERGRKNSKKRHELLYGKDIFFTINTRIRRSLWRSLRKINGNKQVHKYLGWSASDLVCHLERLFTAGMTMDALIRGEIHIDHIRPVCSFHYESMDDPEFKQCWSLSNLQPLWAEENHSKGGRWNGQ